MCFVTYWHVVSDCVQRRRMRTQGFEDSASLVCKLAIRPPKRRFLDALGRYLLPNEVLASRYKFYCRWLEWDTYSVTSHRALLLERPRQRLFHKGRYYTLVLYCRENRVAGFHFPASGIPYYLRFYTGKLMDKHTANLTKTMYISPGGCISSNTTEDFFVNNRSLEIESSYLTWERQGQANSPWTRYVSIRWFDQTGSSVLVRSPDRRWRTSAEISSSAGTNTYAVPARRQKDVQGAAQRLTWADVRPSLFLG